MTTFITIILFFIVLVILTVIGTWVVILFVSMIWGIYAGYSSTVFGFEEYECKNKYKKWVNWVRYLVYILMAVIPDIFFRLGVIIGIRLFKIIGDKDISGYFKRLFIYSDVDTCKEK